MVVSVWSAKTMCECGPGVVEDVADPQVPGDGAGFSPDAQAWARASAQAQTWA
jgi:hypothetical protein